MALLLPQFGSLSEDMQTLIAALQIEFGKIDATGRWITPVHDPTAYTLEGAGNSWVVTLNSADPVSYCLIGAHAMVLNLNISTSDLTVATATNLLFVRLPDDYVMQGDRASGTVLAARTCYSVCEIANGGLMAGLLFAGSGADRVTIRKQSALDFTTASTSLRGQIVLDVKRKGT